MRTKHFNIYSMTPKMILSSLFLQRTPVADELLESLTRFYYLKKTIKHPDLETARFRNRLNRRATQWYRFFRRKMSGIDLLVVWNGFSIPVGAAVAAARECGVKTLFCENGTLPGTLSMDPAGVNFNSSLTGKPPEFFRRITMDDAKVKDLLRTPLQQRPLRNASGIQKGFHDHLSLPERYVLFAMQVHDDTQVLLFSPHLQSMEAAVTYVAEQVKDYNARSGDHVRLVVKEHPSDYGRVDYSSLRASFPDIYFLLTTPVNEALQDALAVLTLNSSVGVEALIRFRPVITLGEAFYNVPGVVRHVEPKEDLSKALSETIDQPIDRDLVTRFLYFLRYEYLVPVSVKSAARQTIAPAVQRVMDAVDGKLS
ncbi:MAG: hypothetical protein Q7N50_12845 [Armatimonadota bacterium]|nr:hypothetical protein [Armatimonadota bacterium]